MRYRILPVVVAVLFSGCSSTPEELEKSEAAARSTKAYTENYQEIYRRISSSAKRCRATNSGRRTSFEVDAELYNELGFGEVTLSLANWGTRNYYWKAKVEKRGSGSLVSAVSGNTMMNGVELKHIFAWADGNSDC